VVGVGRLEANPVAEPAGGPAPEGEGHVSLGAAVVAPVAGPQVPGSEDDHLHRACLAPAAMEGGGDEGAPARWHGASPLGHGTPSSVPSLTPSGYVRPTFPVSRARPGAEPIGQGCPRLQVGIQVVVGIGGTATRDRPSTCSSTRGASAAASSQTSSSG